MSALHDGQTPPHSVAVIGVGTMGRAFARRLLATGRRVAVWSRRTASTKELVDLGATAFDAAPDAVREAEVVITMLPNAAVTEEVMLARGALAAMAPQGLWIQMATIGVEATQRFVASARSRRPDVVVVDAPVSGSREPAENGRLLILASGPPEVVDSLGPVFSALGRATLCLGPAGAGSAMKLVLNTWLAFQVEGAAEAAALASHLGLPNDALTDALADNPLASPYARAKLDRMLEGDYHADFSLDLALKDLDLVGADGGAGSAPIAGAIADRWRALVRDGSSGLDVSAARQGLAIDAT